jgi:hypothetical protein
VRFTYEATFMSNILDLVSGMIGKLNIRRALAVALLLLSLAQQALALEPPLCVYHASPNTVDKPIPAGHPTLRPRRSSMVAGALCSSTDYVNDFKTALAGTEIGINADKHWTFAFWQATASDPLVTVSKRGGGSAVWDYAVSQGWPRLRIPKNAYPAAYGITQYRDRHMAVYDPTGSFVTEFFGMIRTESASGPTWSASAIRRWPRNSAGYLGNYDFRGSARLCAMSMAHGVIRYDELTKGTHEIKHALTFAYKYPAIGKVAGVPYSMFPCARQYASSAGAEANPRKCLMPLGIRLQFDPTANPATECRLVDPRYRNSCISIIRAMQKYGLILVDGGGNVIYAEDLTYKTQKWSDHAATGYALPPTGKAALKGVNFWGKLRAIEPVQP